MNLAQGLSRRGFVIGYIAAMTLFFVLGGPLWEHPFDIDANVWWSYAAIPPLVVLLLVWERRLGWTGFLLDTFGLVLLKFATTYVIAALAWYLGGEPPSRPPPTYPSASPRAPAIYSDLPDPAHAATVTGVVRDPEGQPIADALVVVERGFSTTYAPPAQPLRLEGSAQGFSPRAAALAAGQELVIASADGRLHTAHGGALNYPAVPGRPSQVHFDRSLGVMLYGCQVHSSEPASALVVTSHPFATRTDTGGAFSLRGLPPAELELLALDPDLRVGRAKVSAPSGGAATVELVVRERLAVQLP
jgi:hypothetical protein